MANRLGIVLNSIIATAAFFLCLATMWQFVWHLSSHDHAHFGRVAKESVFYSLLVDAGLLAVFMAQHSVMATKSFKQRLSFLHSDFEVLQRTVYTISTCIILQLMMKFWRPVHSIFLWEVDTASNASWWWIFTSVHWLLWFIIYGGVLVMDVGELVGIKQVYYNMMGLPDPLFSKSRNLRRLYRHMRHPSLMALAVILWFHPVMRMDRTLLAAVLVWYVVVASSVDERDHMYHRHQLLRKEMELRSS